MTTRKHFPGHKQARRDAAAEREEARAERSDAEQLVKLQGEGHGHCEEAKKLTVDE